MMNENLDPRRNVYRSDLASTSLQNRVKADRYVDGQTAQIAATAPVRKEPSHDAMQITQALRGETVDVFDTRAGWAWVQLKKDGYVGYIQLDMLATGLIFSTHSVIAPRALLFPRADLKAPPIGCVFLGSELAINGQEGEYAANTSGGYIHNRTIASVGTIVDDYVSMAERFLGATYLWGGKTADGLDCSGLVQIAMHAAGMTCPRDSDMQMAEVGTSLGANTPLDTLQRGDLVFWSGHVGIMQDQTCLLHANAWHMETAREPLIDAITRIGNSGSPVLDIRRP